MKGKVIKDSDGNWLVEYKEDCFDGITIYHDHWTRHSSIRFIDIKRLIETEIIKENDYVDFEFVENKNFFQDSNGTKNYYAKIINYGSSSKRD